MRSIEARRTFQDFDDWWGVTIGPMIGGIFARIGPEQTAVVRERVRASVEPSAALPFVQTARANAIKARVAPI